MGNICSLCISSNKIHPIVKKKNKSKIFKISTKKSLKKKFKSERKSKSKSKYVIIPQESNNNIYSDTRI